MLAVYLKEIFPFFLCFYAKLNSQFTAAKKQEAYVTKCETVPSMKNLFGDELSFQHAFVEFAADVRSAMALILKLNCVRAQMCKVNFIEAEGSGRELDQIK